MKIKKKLFIIIIIFSILQLFGAIFINSVHAEDSIVDKVFEGGKAWEDMGSNNSKVITDASNEVQSSIDTIMNIVKVLGASIFILYFAITIIMLNRGDIQDKAKVKLHLGLSLGLAILFIYSDKVFDIITSIFESIEDLM